MYSFAVPTERPYYIDGRFRVAQGRDGAIQLKSPANAEDEVASFATSLLEVDVAITAAAEASLAWRRTSEADRAALLRRYRERLLANRDAIAHDLSREVGKPTWEARAEVDAMAAKVELTLGEGATWTETRKIDSLPGEIRFRPLGVIAVVGPFNFPGHLPNGHIVPALMLGNTVVFKPSDKTPLTAIWLTRCLHEAGLPPGVFNLVHGDAKVAEKLIAHEGIDGILFTGSLPVGQRIVALNAHRPGVLVALELGGKNASIVLDDADLERAARQVAFSGFATAGQRCTATSRVFVSERIAEAFVARVAGIARNTRVGSPFEDGVFMGPLISDASKQAVLRAQASAEAAGFHAAARGGIVAASHVGNYLRPSVHVAPSANATLTGYTDQELFGPDLCVYAVKDDDEALTLANRTPYGLAAAVFTTDADRFERLARDLRVGVVHYNRSTAGASGRLPFGGIGASGNHRPAGILAGLSCSYAQSVYLAPAVTDPPGQWTGFGA